MEPKSSASKSLYEGGESKSQLKPEGVKSALIRFEKPPLSP